MTAAAEGWIVLYASPRRWLCHERALVLQAMGIEHLIVDGPRNSALLLVPPEDLPRAREQLELWEAENAGRPAPPPGLVIRGNPWPGCVAWVMVLVAAFLAQGRYAFGFDWLEAGGLDGAAVRQGEWWRVVTALTLHADPGHLVANLAFGAFFGLFAAQYLGSGLAFATILLGGAAGDALDVLLMPVDHRAIGASTAVFAALGLVAAFVWLGHARRTLGWARRVAPLVGGAVLLAYIGTGDAQTDAVAHLTGFLAGFAAGAGFGWRLPAVADRDDFQLACGALALALIATCWWLAALAWRGTLAS